MIEARPRSILLGCLAAASSAACGGGSSPVSSGDLGDSRASTDRPLVQRGEDLGLTEVTPQAVVKACRDASKQSEDVVMCPPLVPKRSRGGGRGEQDGSYVLDFEAPRLERDNGGHWTFTANPPEWLRQVIGQNIAEGNIRPQPVTIAGLRAHALRVPSATGGLYGNHVVLIWETASSSEVHISSHGFASLPRLRLMAEAVIRHQDGAPTTGG